MKRDVVALWIAGRDPRTPLAREAGPASVAAYALSPIDLIPDFVPVLGYLDDLMIVPLGILLAVRLVPDELMAEFRADADRRPAAEKPLRRRRSSRSGSWRRWRCSGCSDRRRAARIRCILIETE